MEPGIHKDTKEPGMENRMKKLLAILTILIGFTSYAVTDTVEDYKKACQSQDAKGCFSLGLAYAKGIEIEQDYELAKDFLEIACDLGNTQACAELKDVDQHRDDSTVGTSDTKEDNEFMRDGFKYCERGDSAACLVIGLSYEDEAEDTSNYTKAEEYYKKACDLGNSLACSSLESLYKEGKVVKHNYAKAKEDDRVIKYRRACDYGDGFACYDLAFLYERGSLVAKNDEKANQLYLRACRLNNNACLAIATYYEAEDNPKEAIYYFDKACETNGKVCSHLAELYEAGKYGLDKDLEKAKKYYKKACDHGNKDACVKYRKMRNN